MELQKSFKKSESSVSEKNMDIESFVVIYLTEFSKVNSSEHSKILYHFIDRI